MLTPTPSGFHKTHIQMTLPCDIHFFMTHQFPFEKPGIHGISGVRDANSGVRWLVRIRSRDTLAEGGGIYLGKKSLGFRWVDEKLVLP